MTPQQLDDKVKEQEVTLSLLDKQIKQSQDKLNQLQRESEILNQVNIFFSSQINLKILDTKHKIETLVNQGLGYIFKDDIKIRIDSAFKNNKTVFSLRVSKAGLNEGVSESFGGGVLAVVAVLLKVSAILLTKTERLLVMDEALTFVSKEYQEQLSQFLQQLCTKLDFTIIHITHQPKLALNADKIYQITGNPKQGVSFKEITSEELQNEN